MIILIQLFSFCLSLFQYTLAQPTGFYTAASGQRLAYAPSVSATPSTYLQSAYPQSASQAITSAQASNVNAAIQYAPQIYQPNLAAKYGYSQFPTAQKYFYASS